MLDYIILDLTTKFLILLTLVLLYKKFVCNNITGFLFLTILAIIFQLYSKQILSIFINVQFDQELIYLNESTIIATLFILPIIYSFKNPDKSTRIINGLNIWWQILLLIICEIILFISRLKFIEVDYRRGVDIAIICSYFMIYILFLELISNNRNKLIILFIMLDIIISLVAGNSSFKNVIIIGFAAIIKSRGINGKINNLIYPCIIILIIGLNLWFDNKILLKYTISNLDLYDKVNFIFNNINLIPENNFLTFIEKLIDRVGYIEFVALTVENIPSFHGFEYGNITLDSINRFLMPSFIYMDKPIINDSLRTNYYLSNFLVVDVEKSSIGLGYISELYIDFGIGIVLLGIIISVFINKLYTIYGKHNLIPSLDYSIFFNFYLIEQSITKVLPAFLHTILITTLMLVIYEKFRFKYK